MAWGEKTTANGERDGEADAVDSSVWTPILVALGSNLGATDENLRTATRFLATTPGVRRLRTSSIWRTFPVGGPSEQPIFSNAVAFAETTLEPLELLRELMKIEQKMRRVRDVFWGPRTLDLDLILFGDVVLRSSELTVPHPRAVWRDFVLGPACEVAPNFRFPTTGWTVAEHRAALLSDFANFESFSYWTRRVATEADFSATFDD